MSGGPWDYLYLKVQDAADRLRSSPEDAEGDPLQPDQVRARKMLGSLLTAVSYALKAVEYVDSCDSSYPDDTDAISRMVAVVGSEALVSYIKALEVFGDARRAMTWMFTPCAALGGYEPINRRPEEVVLLLGRLEHGIFS